MGDMADDGDFYFLRHGHEMFEIPEREEMSTTAEEIRVKGKIIKVHEAGWGFISSKDIKFTRIFFHWTSLKQNTLKFVELKNGLKVEFTPVEVEGKGWRAIKIEVITDEPESIDSTVE
jgi:cold shock CspA family protein